MKKPGRRCSRPTKCASPAIPSPASWPRRSRKQRTPSEAIEVDIDPLPSVTTPDQAVAKSAPVIFDDVPGNIALDFHYGDSDKVAAAFATAEHKVKLKLINTPRDRQRDRAARGHRRSTTRRKERFTLHSVQPRRDGTKAGILA